MLAGFGFEDVFYLDVLRCFKLFLWEGILVVGGEGGTRAIKYTGPSFYLLAVILC